MDTAQKNTIAELLDIEALPLEEHEALFAQIGNVVFEAALQRYVTEVSEDEVKRFESDMEALRDDEALFEKIFTAYPTFASIYEEEMTALQSDIASEFKEITA